MKHERDIINGHRYNFDPYDEPSNTELGIKPYPGWVLFLIWFGAFLAGASAWVALVKWVLS